MKSSKFLFFFILFLFVNACFTNSNYEKKMFQYDDMIIRIAALEIDTMHIEEYIAILKEEAAASVKKEAGVICIFPMYEKDNPTHIRLLEIYADEAAYQAHLKTPHFLHYKTTTLPMVKSLKLIDMEAIDKELMSDLFRKLGSSPKNKH